VGIEFGLNPKNFDDETHGGLTATTGTSILLKTIYSS